MDYRKMSGQQLIVETKKDPPDMLGPNSLAVITEIDRRDAMLAAAGKMAEAMEQAVRPCERCGLISVADQVRSSLSAWRAAEGGAT